MKDLSKDKARKSYIKPQIEKIDIDNQISLAMTSPSAPPSDPFGSIDMKKMLEQDKLENA